MEKTRLARALIVSVGLVVFLAAAVPAADRLVIIVWDVGETKFFYQAEAVDAFNPASNTWEIPTAAVRAGLTKENCTSLCPFNPGTEEILKKGDRIRLYVTNYNPVAHVPEDGVVTLITDDSPTPLLGALLQVVLGGKLATPAAFSSTDPFAPPAKIAMASAYNQVWQAPREGTEEVPVGVAPIHIALEDAAEDARVRITIPEGDNFVWDTSVEEIHVSGPASAKVDRTVGYADSDKTVVLTVNEAFRPNDQFAVHGLRATDLNAASEVRLTASTGEAAPATDEKRISIASNAGEVPLLILEGITESVARLNRSMSDLRAGTRVAHLAAFSQAVDAVPSDPELWKIFDNAKAWKHVHALLAGKLHVAAPADLTAEIQKTRDSVAYVVGLAGSLQYELSLYDRAYEGYVAGGGANASWSARRAQAGVALASFTGLLAAASTDQFGPTLTKFLSARSTYLKIRKMLDPSSSGYREADHVHTVLHNDELAEQTDVRFDVPFKAHDKALSRKLSRNVVLKMAPHYPAFIMSVGVGFNFLDLQTIGETAVATQMTTGTPPMTTDVPIATKKFVTTDDDTYNAVTPVWLQHLKTNNHPTFQSVYFTFGTTPDKNIFENILLGGSYYHPPWRLLFTAGAIGAKGFRDADLKREIESFNITDSFRNEIARPTTTVAALTAELETEFQWRFFFSFSLKVFSF